MAHASSDDAIELNAIGKDLGTELGTILGRTLGTELGTDLGTMLGARLDTVLGAELGTAIGLSESNADDAIDVASNAVGAINVGSNADTIMLSNAANESSYADGAIDFESNTANESSYAGGKAIESDTNAEEAIESDGSNAIHILAVGDNKLKRMHGTTQGTTGFNQVTTINDH